MAVTVTVGATSRDYSTLQAAWNALPSTLTDDYVFELYNDAAFSSGLNTASSSKTFGSYGLTIRPASGQGFRDHASKTTNALRYNQSNGVAVSDSPFLTPLINVGAYKITLDGLQLKHTNFYAIGGTGGSTNLTIKNCLVVGERDDTEVIAAESAGTCSIVNNVVIQSGDAAAAVAAGPGTVMRNNTVVYIGSGSSSSTGVTANGGALTAIGNAVFGFTNAFGTGFLGSFHASCDYNATNLGSTGTGTGSNNVTSLTYSSQFEAVGTYGSEDLRVKAGSSLINAGTYDAAIDPDIISRTRDGSTPTIGAWEYLAAALSEPTGVSASTARPRQFTLSWTDASTGETGFDVQYAPSPYTSWTTAPASPAAANATTIDITGLTPDTLYKGRVRAAGGSPSNWVESSAIRTLAILKVMPVADTYKGDWTASTGSDLYAMIDETSPSDSDYIQTTVAGACKIRLASTTVAAVLTDHRVPFRAKGDNTSQVKVSLVQGHPSEIEIAATTVTPTTSSVDYELNLLTTQADDITDPTDLYLRFEAL